MINRTNINSYARVGVGIAAIIFNIAVAIFGFPKILISISCLLVVFLFPILDIILSKRKVSRKEDEEKDTRDS